MEKRDGERGEGGRKFSYTLCTLTTFVPICLFGLLVGFLLSLLLFYCYFVLSKVVIAFYVGKKIIMKLVIIDGHL